MQSLDWRFQQIEAVESVFMMDDNSWLLKSRVLESKVTEPHESRQASPNPEDTHFQTKRMIDSVTKGEREKATAFFVEDSGNNKLPEPQ